MSSAKANRQTLGQAIGSAMEQRRRSRGMTQAELARRARERGLRWSEDTVHLLEAGRRDDVGIKELVKLSDVFEDLLWTWFLGDGEIDLGDGVIITRAGLRARLGAPPERILHKLTLGDPGDPLASGERTFLREIGITQPPAGLGVAPEDGAMRIERNAGGLGGSPKVWADLLSGRPTDTERDVAKQLRISPKTLIELSLELWDNRIDDARDKRAGPLESATLRQRQARRGHETRRLIDELRARIAERRRARTQTNRYAKEKRR
jgi:transcriptional regulator with XRE-family HTH domain